MAGRGMVQTNPWHVRYQCRKQNSYSSLFALHIYITRMRREVAGETIQKIAGHNSLAMTDHYTRAAIPEMVEAVKPAMEAANRLFE